MSCMCMAIPLVIVRELHGCDRVDVLLDLHAEFCTHF